MRQLMRGRWRRLAVAGVAAAVVGSVAAPAGAERPERRVDAPRDSYIVVMAADPLVQTEGKDNLDTARAAKRQNELKQSHKKALQAAGVGTDRQVHDYTAALNGFSALLTADEVAAVRRQSGVLMVLKDQFRERTTDSSGSFLELDAPAGPWRTGLNGEGVVVGVIDDGIWPEHPSFADDGSYPPLPGFDGVPCEFGNTAQNPADAPFDCNNKLLGARQVLDTYRAVVGADPDEFGSARDDNGHGTHTASTAASNAGVSASILGCSAGSSRASRPALG